MTFAMMDRFYGPETDPLASIHDSLQIRKSASLYTSTFGTKTKFFLSMRYSPAMDDLTELANTRMPFGKYKDRFLLDLPEAYLVWFSRQGFPDGKLGRMLASMLEIKLNGLETLLVPLIMDRKEPK